MNFFLIFALIFFTIIVAIFLQKLVNSPILIGLLFFDNCNNSNDVSTANLNTTNNNCSCSSSQPLTILNSDGEIVARINGDNVTCTSQQNDNNSCLRSYRHS